MYRSLLALSLCTALIGCSRSSSEEGAGNATSGSGTVTVTGDINIQTTFGSGQKGTRVACLRNPKINFSDVTLTVEGKSKARPDASEQLYFSFDTANYPSGLVSFTSGLPISYIIGDESYSNFNVTKNCYAKLISSGTSLSGTLYCADMVGDQGGKIDLEAKFDCSVKTLE